MQKVEKAQSKNHSRKISQTNDQNSDKQYTLNLETVGSQSKVTDRSKKSGSGKARKEVQEAYRNRSLSKMNNMNK